MIKNSNSKVNCESCYEIKCQECGWVASKKEIEKIKIGQIKLCPLCGWSPHS